MSTQTDDAPKIHGPISREQADKLNAAGNESARTVLSEMGIAPTTDSDLVSFTNDKGQIEGYASTYPGDEGTFLGKRTIAEKGLLLEAERSDRPAGKGQAMLEAAADSVRAASKARAAEGQKQMERPLQPGGIDEVPGA